MDEEYTENPAIFPTDETIAKSEPSIYLGEAAIRLRDEAWTRIQAA
jgi:spermidine/putrescine transport system substrate-binding protein